MLDNKSLHQSVVGARVLKLRFGTTLGELGRYPSQFERIPMLPTFTLTETYALGGEYTWRLKDSQIRYRGSHRFAGLINQRIPASDNQINAFNDALELLDVWSWRDDYAPEDVGLITMDGSAWSFAASIGNRECNCAGTNGYPSFAATSQTTTDRGRFALLLAAMYACFDIDTYVHVAKHQRERELKNDG